MSIGFSLNNSLSKLIMGAVIGSVLGQIYMILTSSKLNLRKRGMTIGGLWGIVSFFIGINQTIYFYQTKKSIFILPHLILVILSDKLNLFNDEGMVSVILSFFVLLLDILLGAIIGIIIVSAIEKYRMQRTAS
ncbi:MAG: hypothetical protein ACXACY_31165 [Candidatus Hodarchaeales archaeon]